MSSQLIEIHNDEKYRYLLDAEYQGANFIVFILRLRKVIRNDAYEIAHRISNGNLTLSLPTMKKSSELST